MLSAYLDNNRLSQKEIEELRSLLPEGPEKGGQ